MRRTSQLLSVLVFVLSAFPVFAATPIINPYAEVNWETYGKHKANLHTHTVASKIRDDGSVIFNHGLIQAPDGTVLRGGQTKNAKRRHPEFRDAQGRAGGSDGWITPTRIIDIYRGLGYTILALTDHNMVTWPWQDYGRDPKALGMLAVQGSEPSRHHHMGSYFNDYNGGARGDLERSIRTVGERNGLAVMFHPGRYSANVDHYVNLYQKYDHLVGMEVYNQRDRYSKDRELWDKVLTRLMPQRPVWGMANDDAHIGAHIGNSWQVFLLPELTEEALRHAMRNGHSFFSNVRGGHPKDGSDPAPVIESIRVDKGTARIGIQASGYDRVEWISAGRVIAEGPVLDANGRQGYVRAVLIGGAGRTYTQPFFIGDPAKGTPTEE